MDEPTTPYVVSEINSTTKAYRNNYKEYHDQKAKGISFSAFLLSVFIYISIFYIFDLSPSSLINTTKFWFFISNTLILIIAADYGTFSSSKQRQDYVYENQYMMHNTTSSSALPLPLPVQEVENSEEKKEFSKKSEIIIPENKLEIIIIKSGPEKPSDGIQETSATAIETALEEAQYVEDENRKTNRAICCSETDQNHEDQSCVVEENNEFSSMTDEELNRRVEEFIQKFNRQIRLQRAGHFG